MHTVYQQSVPGANEGGRGGGGGGGGVKRGREGERQWMDVRGSERNVEKKQDKTWVK